MSEAPANTPNEDPSNCQPHFPIAYEGRPDLPNTDHAQSRGESIAPIASRPGYIPRSYASRRADLGSHATKKLLGRNPPRFSWTGRDFSHPETSQRPKQPLPERYQHEPALDYLGRCIAFTPQEKEDIEDAIEEVRTELTMLHFDDPKTVHNINMHAQDAAWGFIAEANQPAPACLAEAGGTITTTYRPVISIYDAFASKMQPHAQRVHGLISDNQNELSLIINEAVESSNTYQMLHGFSATAKTRVERPLTHTERAIRESIVAREVIRDFGLQPYQLGKPAEHGPAFVAYKNRLFALDNETVPAHKSDETTSDESFEALREWALSMAKAYNSLGVNASTITTLGEGAYVAPDFTNYIAEQLDGTPCNSILAGILGAVIARAFSKHNKLTYQEAFQDAVGKAQRLDTSFIKNGYARSVGLSSLNNSLLMWIRQTDCSNLQRHYIGEQFLSFGSVETEDGMHSREAAAESESRQIGSVLYDARTLQEREFARIIFEQTAGIEQPLTDTNGQQRALSLAWGSDETPKQVHNHSIYIPGFTVIAARQQGNQVVFDFVRDPAGDPYRPTNDQLTLDQQLAIQRHYRNLGITTIANKLAATEPQTVYETAQVIRQNSSYYLPQKSTPHSFTIKNAQMFAQCKGGAEIGQRALADAQIASRVIKGLALPEEGTAITLAGHSQVMVVQNGKRQIFDFTPETATKDQIQKQMTPQPKNTPEPLSKVSKPNPTQQVAIERDPREEALRQYNHSRAAFGRTRQAFEQTLRGQLRLPVDTPSDHIYERFVASTTTADIWWQTTSALFMAYDTLQQTAATTADPSKLEPLITELQNIAKNAEKISALPKEQRARFASTDDHASLNALSNTATQASAQLAKLAHSLAILHQD